MSVRLALLVAAALALGAQPVRAFQDPVRFSSSPEEAGGGGRYFTGSPADGFRCTVCHTGTTVPVRVQGLPDGAYMPGRSYRFVITWDAPTKPVGMNAEVTDLEGHTAGELSAPPPDELGPADMCEPIDLGMPNAGVLPVPDPEPEGDNDRQLAIAFACGARQATFVWQAPMEDLGPVWFTGSLVASDELGTLDGDGVADFAHVFGSPARPDPLAAEISGVRSCALTRAPHSAGASRLATALASLATLLWWQRHRRRRRRRRHGHRRARSAPMA